MQGGDLETWISPTVVVVLEDVLATVTEPRKVGWRRRAGEYDPEDWTWHEMPLRSVVDMVDRLGLRVEVITFMGQDVADAAAEWFQRYDVRVTEVEAVNFMMFTRSLIRRPEVDRVVDTDTQRLIRYGQKGHGVRPREAFV